MSRSKQKRTAEELLGLGLPHQQVFDQLRAENPEAKPKKLADSLRYMPGQYARERYRTVHRLLLVVIVLSAALRVWRSTNGTDFQWDDSFRMITLVPVASLLVGWGLYRWRGQLFRWIGWMNLLGGVALLSKLRNVSHGDVEPWVLGSDVLSVLIGALALYLFIKVFPKYEEEEDPFGGPKRYVFKQDDVGVLMR